MQSPGLELLAVPHGQLTAQQLDQLRTLFDGQYLAAHGAWRPEQPYGYAPHDVHLVAVSRLGIVGHAGWGRRSITVGGAPVTIAGVGGVLIAPAARGRRIGRRLMQTARRTMLASEGVEFGYLGCDESVAGFYRSCGWHRIRAAERWIDRHGRAAAAPPGPPLFILPVCADVGAWPAGEVDLRGRAW